MARPVVKQKYTHLKAMEEMYSLESYIEVNKNEATDDISYRTPNQLRHSIQTTNTKKPRKSPSINSFFSKKML